MLTAKEIRQQFIDFFVQKHAHTFVPSSSVVPWDDPTLLFTNAGMNQFKDVFLATGSRPYRRAANTQKCIRAGGKHNDLDDVGKDTYHHTFFEMLGNWSFGDYFKKEAIQWAWELLTEVWKLDKTRLHATVFEGDKARLEPDTEAFELWKSVTDIDPTHIHWGNKKDNFWEMGETGPCGPCTEIHIDRTPNKTGGKLVNAGTPDVMEIWNLVFIQFNRGADTQLTPLPAKHVDTGMGFERVTSVLQGKSSNYDTDVFTPIFSGIQRITGAQPYTGSLEAINDIAYRVIADHIRTLTFALTDGAVPSNEGRGYVLRRILRRAVRFGRQYFGMNKPFLCELVPTVVEVMGSAFPELERNPRPVVELIADEEKSFIRTLDRGIKLFQEAAGRADQAGSKTISGKDAFELHDTFGMYIDITEQMASETGMSVDRVGYQKLMDEAKERNRQNRKKLSITAVTGALPKTDDAPKYGGRSCEAKLLGWVANNTVVTQGKANLEQEVALLVDRSCFYAEQGGQVGDTGVLATGTGRFEVEDTQKLGDTVLHVGRVVDGWLEVGQTATLEVNPTRLDTMRNHTCTHLLNWALRKVLGEHVEQKGSLVDADKTRFDFAHSTALSQHELLEIERLVNEKICADQTVSNTLMPLADAKKLPGVRAVFGEKYPDQVRVLVIGPTKLADVTADHSIEFCGGTHLCHTGQAGFFKIVSQEAVAKGVRRLTAVTGRGALAYIQRTQLVLDDLTSKLNCKPDEIASRLDALHDEVKKLKQDLKKGASQDLRGAADKLLEQAETVQGAKLIVGELPAGPDEQFLQQADYLRQKAGSAIVVLASVDEEKVKLVSAVTDDLVKKGAHAGKLIGPIAKALGGGGGGKPNLAQAGGKDASKLPDALTLALKLAKEMLGG